jgi:ketosteroid isomerase-like protein
MSAEDNRQTAIKYFELAKARNMPFAEELVTDDCTWWAAGFGTMDRKTFLGVAEQIKPLMPTMPTMTVVATTAEGDRVAMEAQGSAKLSDGRMYDNVYHFLFLFRNGRICQVKEYFDTKYAADLFGAPG